MVWWNSGAWIHENGATDRKYAALSTFSSNVDAKMGLRSTLGWEGPTCIRWIVMKNGRSMMLLYLITVIITRVLLLATFRCCIMAAICLNLNVARMPKNRQKNYFLLDSIFFVFLVLVPNNGRCRIESWDLDSTIRYSLITIFDTWIRPCCSDRLATVLRGLRGAPSEILATVQHIGNKISEPKTESYTGTTSLLLMQSMQDFKVRVGLPRQIIGKEQTRKWWIKREDLKVRGQSLAAVTVLS